MLVEQAFIKSFSIGEDSKLRVQRTIIILRDDIELHRYTETVLIDGDYEDEKVDLILDQIKTMTDAASQAVERKRQKKQQPANPKKPAK